MYYLCGQVMQDKTMAVKVTEATEDVLNVLSEGRATPGYIHEETGRSRNTIHNQLNALLAADCIKYVHKPTGLYELVEDPRE